ncbi:FUSC family protein [Photobacterium sp. J15]|uniref:FUSC family protein n=1 Tax=Photobacterium sp. J15 TaxID=265901 RepID=UPI0007E3D844|nr:FUSC family protein [Photobacterium sp. J15]
MISERCKLPLKVALALTLAIVSALWLGWDKPYWAAFAVIVMAATETSGHSLRKGRHRVLGTIAGVISAFVFVGLYAQQPLPFLLTFSLFAAVCVYLQTNPRNGYMWSITLMVCSLILVMGKLSGELTFNIAMLRLQETLLGVLCFTLVFSLLWPVSSRRLLHATLQGFFVEQQEKVSQSACFLAGEGERLKGLGFGDGMRFLSRIEDLLPAAMADSYHVSREIAAWQRFLVQLKKWALLCGHLSEACDLLDSSEIPGGQAELLALLARIKQRFATAGHLLDLNSGKPNTAELSAVERIRLHADHDINPQYSGAILLLEQVLNQMDELSFELLVTLQEAVGQRHGNANSSNRYDKSVKSNGAEAWFRFDPERIYPALKTVIVVWVCIALWLYVPMPGGAMIVLLGVILGSVVFTLPFCNVKSLLYTMMAWSLVVLLQYVLLMPVFTEVWQLALFYFINAFGIWFVFWQPQQLLTKMLGSQLLVMMTMGAVQLTPQYDIQFALLQLLLIVVVMLVIFFVNQTFFSSQPEQVLLRQMSRVRHLFIWQLRLLGKPGHQQNRKQKVISKWLNNLIWNQSSLHPVAVAEVATTRINWAGYPDVDTEKLSLVISRLYAANLRLNSLRDSYRAYLAVQDEGSTSRRNADLDRWLANSVTALSNLLEKTNGLYCLQPTKEQLAQILSHLHLYRQEINSDSLLQLTLSREKASKLYQLVAALKLLLDELKQLNGLVSEVGFEQLRYRYFSL